ncbi:ferritin [Candidatus Peregrinibacteria bacterium]|jgi:ferritin|nr:ferritin [Candidatus Peregrinibacteria bacterium]MBT7484688.1 ferritin [Candidatus Peregrinibacteria bacterium]MBT7703711.1 ferritin [Candidatus Peregrinibacteria bacterium]
MKKSINDALNKQINAEIYSAYLYLAMGAYFDGLGLDGFASWMKVQYEEEMFHAMKFYGFVYERGGTVTMEAIEKPGADFKSVLHVFEETLEHEKHVTSLINGLYDLAVKEKDYAFQSLLNWFIDEQVEEEDSAQKIIDKIKLAGEKGPGVYMLDQELGTRVFTPPAKGEA